MPADGVPFKSPAELNVTPLGKAPPIASVGDGNPVATTAKLSALPTVNVAPLGLVIVGMSPTDNKSDCVAGSPTPLLAKIVTGYEPSVPGAGVPLKSPAGLSVTPLGNGPVSLKVTGR